MSDPIHYEHRMMRCKLDRSALIEGHRYRPGEILREGHKHTDDFEAFISPAPVEPPVTPPLVALRAKPAPGERVVRLPNLKETKDGH